MINQISDQPKINIIGEINQQKRNYTEKIKIYRGDITNLEVDAIVNAANETLLGGGGIDKAVHDNAGGLLLYDCALNFYGCETGRSVVTKGYNLPAKYVIHSVGWEKMSLK
eukprot:TRINITY_DN7375_c0_g1_i2.p1 TRINITY_DN7375_c0_g1~~TRINITY_DN7375_c0_g1_i2.p1  ORF type:complete len:111 (+),score=18.94 TRINITY_DN7375_c0_g1_i2:255-587(+)